MKMPFLLISPKIVPKIQLIKKGGCFEYHAVIADKIEYRYIHRASICPASGMDRRSFFMPKTMGKYKRLEVFHLSKPVYTVDKPSDCHYCYFWTNGRKGCRLGRNNCYYLISLPPKPKSECDGCPYGRDHPCIGWCTKKVNRSLSQGAVSESGCSSFYKGCFPPFRLCTESRITPAAPAHPTPASAQIHQAAGSVGATANCPFPSSVKQR